MQIREIKALGQMLTAVIVLLAGIGSASAQTQSATQEVTPAAVVKVTTTWRQGRVHQIGRAHV